MWSLYRNDRDRLRTFMAHFRDKAAIDLPDLTAEQIEARFTGWIADPPVRRRSTIKHRQLMTKSATCHSRLDPYDSPTPRMIAARRGGGGRGYPVSRRTAAR